MQIVSPVISRCLSTLRNSKLGAQFFLTVGRRLKFVPSRESSVGWFTLPFDYRKGSFVSLTFAYIPALGRQLLTRERCHLACDPQNAIVLGHQLGIGREPGNALRP